jgi:hypothetical protein
LNHKEDFQGRKIGPATWGAPTSQSQEISFFDSETMGFHLDTGFGSSGEILNGLVGKVARRLQIIWGRFSWSKRSPAQPVDRASLTIRKGGPETHGWKERSFGDEIKCMK